MQLLIIKTLDNLISSSKSIHTHELNTKNVFFLSILKSMMLLLVVSKVGTSSYLDLAIASVGAGVGSAIPVYLANKNKNKVENIWRYHIKCKDICEAEKLKNIFEANQIETTATENVVSSKSTVVVTAIAHTVNDSKLIMSNIPKGRIVTIDKDIESFIMR